MRLPNSYEGLKPEKAWKVATLTARLLDDGAGWCAIFADVGNATTNTMYRRMGYKEHGTYREYDFAP